VAVTSRNRPMRHSKKQANKQDKQSLFHFLYVTIAACKGVLHLN
jgi:hypothetical protein